MGATVPEWLLTAVIAVTVFTVMFGIGLGVAPGELGRLWRQPAPMLRGLFSVLVAVPVLAIAITRGFELPRTTEIGIVLMAISPGAPVALRRSLGAGAHAAFAAGLQISAALLAVVSMPVSIAALNEVYAGQARIDPRDVMRQVFIAQLLPLALGITLRHFGAAFTTKIEPAVRRAGTVLLVVAVILVLAELWRPLYEAGVPTIAAMVLTTAAALAAGHLLGGPAPTTRTAVAITSAARNPSLALLVATINQASPAIIATVLAYVLVSLLAITPYAAWRHRAARRAAAYASPPGPAAR
ncbi:MAG TPA: bile acid:sodium symporter [Burkholderiales bacterium]|nr:bile acid:sodium symporter [Burkholderiales bacterium]